MNKQTAELRKETRVTNRGNVSNTNELFIFQDPKIEQPIRMRNKHICASTTPLIKKMKDNKEWRIRYRATETLGRIGDPDSFEAICNTLRNDKVSDVRACAAWALGKIGNAMALKSLAEALNDPNARVRQTADLAVKAITGTMKR